MKYLIKYKLFESHQEMEVPTEWDLYTYDQQEDKVRERILVRRTNKEMTKLSKKFKEDMSIYYKVFHNGEDESLLRNILTGQDIEVFDTFFAEENEDESWKIPGNGITEWYEFGDLVIKKSMIKKYFEEMEEVMSNATNLGAMDSEPRTLVWRFVIGVLLPYETEDDAESLVDELIPF